MHNLVAFDKTTGEIKEIAFFRTIEEDIGYRKYLQKQKAIKSGTSLQFIQCIQGTIIDVLPRLTLTECGSFMVLLSYMQQRKDGLLTNKTVPLSQNHIQKILDKSERRTRAILGKLESLDLIRSERVNRSKVYYINESYHTMTSQKNRRKTMHFIKLMKTKLQSLVNDLSIEELGLIYKIIPYFHFNTFALASNPNELDITKINYLNCSGLANELHLDRGTVAKLMAKLNAHGIILSTKSRKNILYYVHPDLLWSSVNPNSEAADTLRKMFNAHKYKSVKEIKH